MSKSYNTQKITIHDISKSTGFSPSTVSRVLGGSDYPVNVKTREIILETARKMNYFSARNMRLPLYGDSKEIGVLIPNISNYYYTTLLQGIQHVTAPNDCNIVLCDSMRNVELEKKNVERLIQKGVKGILIASIDPSGESIRRIISSNIPVVSMEQKVNTPCITTSFNFFSGARLAMEHLVSKGHSNIAFVSPPMVRSSRRELLDGYRFVSMQSGLEIVQEYIFIADNELVKHEDGSGLIEFEMGRDAVDYFLSLPKPPSALFCVNDLIAIGALRRLNELHIAVPNQMAIVGFDNITFSEMTTPGLTTVDQSAFELGRTATTLLFNKSADPSLNENISVLIEPKLIVREST